MIFLQMKSYMIIDYIKCKAMKIGRNLMVNANLPFIMKIGSIVAIFYFHYCYCFVLMRS